MYSLHCWVVPLYGCIALCPAYGHWSSGLFWVRLLLPYKRKTASRLAWEHLQELPRAAPRCGWDEPGQWWRAPGGEVLEVTSMELFCKDLMSPKTSKAVPQGRGAKKTHFDFAGDLGDSVSSQETWGDSFPGSKVLKIENLSSGERFTSLTFLGIVVSFANF